MILAPSPAVAVPAASVRASRGPSTALSAGYVPDGLTRKEYEQLKKKQGAEADAKRKKFAAQKSEVGAYPTIIAVRTGHNSRRSHGDYIISR